MAVLGDRLIVLGVSVVDIKLAKEEFSEEDF